MKKSNENIIGNSAFQLNLDSYSRKRTIAKGTKGKVKAAGKGKGKVATPRPKKRIIAKKAPVGIVAIVDHNNKLPTIQIALTGGNVKAMDKGAKVPITSTMIGVHDTVSPFFTPTTHKAMEKVGAKLFLSDAYSQYLCYSALTTSIKPVIGFDWKNSVIVVNNNKLFDRKSLLIHAKAKFGLDSRDKGTYSHIGRTKGNAVKLGKAIRSFLANK